jgi:hypothetical protein
MRLVDNIDGALQVRFTWLPYWLASNRGLMFGLETWVRDVAVLNAVTTDERDLDALNALVVDHLEARFQIPGFRDFLMKGYALLREDG